MSKEEYFLLIPAIIYGVAIVDLLKVFTHRNTYFELMGWGIVYLLAIINLWLDLYSELEIIANDRLSFILIIGQAILYARGASILTPEASDTDTKLYFMENKKAFFLALASIVLCNLFIQLVVHDDLTPIWYRLSLIGLAIFTAFKAKFKVRVALLGMMLLLISIQLLRHGGLFG